MINSNYHYLLWHCYIVRRYWAPTERRQSKFWWWWWWLCTSTFDVAAHLDAGPTGPPGKFQAALSAPVYWLLDKGWLAVFEPPCRRIVSRSVCRLRDIWKRQCMQQCASASQAVVILGCCFGRHRLQQLPELVHPRKVCLGRLTLSAKRKLQAVHNK